MAPPRLREMRLEACIGSGAFGKVYVCSRVREDGNAAARTVDATPSGEAATTRRMKTRQARVTAPPHRAAPARAEAGQWALKKISKARLESAAMLEQAHREFDVLRIGSKHPFVVDLYWVQETARSMYVCMEYCPGGDLLTHISAGHFKPADCKPVLIEVALALNFLHRNDIIYRDLKPENVAFSKDGHVRLLDFGLAMRLTDKEHRNEATGRLEICCASGTLEYAAPEVLYRRPHGFEADWWSFGILAHEMLCGRPPFEHEDRLKCCEIICTHPIVLHESIEGGSCEEDLLRGLLERKPDKRLGYDVSEFEADILQHPFFAEVDIDALLMMVERGEPLRLCAPRQPLAP